MMAELVAVAPTVFQEQHVDANKRLCQFSYPVQMEDRINQTMGHFIPMLATTAS
jgi:hypothetical protein